MTRWLQAAKKALPPKDITDKTDTTQRQAADSTALHNLKGVLSVKSVLSEGGGPVSEPSPVQVKPRTDVDEYADALRYIGPCGYGPIAVFLGWGATRAANAEEVLRKAGRIIYDHTGRGTLQ